MGTLVARKYHRIVGTGGIGTGLFFCLEGDQTLGREESRSAHLLDIRDYGKLHIILHYAAVLTRDLHVFAFGKVGADAAGERMLREMNSAGISTQYVRQSSSAPTMLSVCFQYPDGTGGNITASNSASSEVTPYDIEACRDIFSTDGHDTIALAAPEVSLETRLRLIQIASEYSAFRVTCFTSMELQTDICRQMLRQTDLLALNAEEAGALMKANLDVAKPDAFLDELAARLQDYSPSINYIVTAGKHGAFAFDGKHWKQQPSFPAEVASTAGAGDALLGGVLALLAAGAPLIQGSPNALEMGVRLASHAVSSPHSIHPDPAAAWDAYSFLSYDSK